MPFVLTGFPRSGTGYTARVLAELGLVVGHEFVFEPRTLRVLPLRWPDGVDGDSSWLAVPYLDRLPPDLAQVRQVRDPIRAVASILKLRFWRPTNLYAAFVLYHLPELAGVEDELERTVRFYLEWSRLADERGRFSLELRVEDLGAAELAALATAVGSPTREDQAAAAIARVPRTMNSKMTRTELELGWSRLSWGDLPEGGPYAELRELALRFGYSPAGPGRRPAGLSSVSKTESA